MIVQFGYQWKLGRPTFMPVLDCRQYIKGCFSVKAARKHPKYKDLMALACEIYDAHDLIAVGCDQGHHRSVALARDLAQREHGEETAYVLYHPANRGRIISATVDQMARSIHGAGILWYEMDLSPSGYWELGSYKLKGAGETGGSKGKLTNKFSPQQSNLLRSIGRYMISQYQDKPAIPAGTDKVYMVHRANSLFWLVSHDSNLATTNSWSIKSAIQQGACTLNDIGKGIRNAI